MNKIILAFLSIWIAATAHSEQFMIDNQTAYSARHQKFNIAIQWANSSKDIEVKQSVTAQELKKNSVTLKLLTQIGKINISSPNKAEYFRVLVWSKGTNDPAFVTNWVNIVPNKIYTLNKEHLIPVALMAGTGC